MTAICVFSIATLLGSNTDAGEFGHGMTADDIFFMVSVGMIDEQFLSLLDAASQDDRDFNTYNDLDRRNPKGISGLDLGSGR